MMRPRHASGGAAAFLVLAAHAVTYPSLARAQGQPPRPVPYNPAPAPVPYDPPATAPAVTSAAVGPRPQVGSDVVYMKNGGMLRGTIIDAIPNSQARIQLATGEIATVPWSEVARIEHAATIPTPATPATPTSRAEPRKSPDAFLGGAIVVHIDSPSNVELQRDMGHHDWQTVCTSPCDAQLPTEGHYRITGEGSRPSREFMIPPSGRTATLTVTPSSQGWFVGGIVLISVGAPMMLIGLVIGAVGSAVSTADPDSGTAHDWARGGWTAALLGAAGLVVGIVGLTSNVHSGVTFGASETAAASPGPPWSRVATWRGATPEARALPQPVCVPFLARSF
jgi:hypothetical protein